MSVLKRSDFDPTPGPSPNSGRGDSRRAVPSLCPLAWVKGLLGPLSIPPLLYNSFAAQEERLSAATVAAMICSASGPNGSETRRSPGGKYTMPINGIRDLKRGMS